MSATVSAPDADVTPGRDADARPSARGAARFFRPLSDFATRYKRDLLAVTVAGLVAGALAFAGTHRIDPAAFEFRNFDIYLQGDMPRTYEQMVTTHHNGGRSGVHPLYPLLVYPPTAVVRFGLGLSPLEAARVVVALFAAIWVVCLFVFVRLVGVRRQDAFLITAVGLAGASAMFWLVVPETFLLGGIALLAAGCVAALSERRRLGDAWYVATGVATFGTTLTNWSTGILLAATARPWRRFPGLCLQAAGAASLLWIAQKLVIPSVTFIFDQHGVRQHIHMPDLARLVDVGRVFFAHAAVAPRLEVCRNAEAGMSPQLLSFQGAAIGSGGALGAIATVVWFVLLGVALYALVRRSDRHSTRLVVGGTLVMQFGIQLLYGGETFLYSMHWWGLLVAVLAFAFTGRSGRLARSLAVAFVLLAGTHNALTWSEATPVFRDGAGAYAPSGRACDA